ncbi:MAG: SDR family oxidoreductase [Haloarculaceae archaeon]
MIEPDLDGRTALVTGSVRGIGPEVLLGLADCGADVPVHYRTSDEAARAVAEVAREVGVAATTVAADVTEPEAVDACVEMVEAALGSVDVLVNNVGAFHPHHWEHLDHADRERLLETNLYGTYLASKRALPAMRASEWGRIVNVGYASSERGLVSPETFPYFVAKNGVIMYTRMLVADTMADGITVNAGSPYVVETSAVFPEELPRERPARFEDVLQEILFFLEADSNYVSGQNLEIDGGWLPERV